MADETIEKILLYIEDFPELYEGEYSILTVSQQNILEQISAKHNFDFDDYDKLFELEKLMEKITLKHENVYRRKILENILRKHDLNNLSIDFTDIEKSIESDTITYSKMKEYVGEIKRKLTQPETANQQRKTQLLKELAQMRVETPSNEKEISSLEDRLRQTDGVSQEVYVNYRALIDSLRTLESKSPEGRKKMALLDELTHMKEECPELSEDISQMEEKVKQMYSGSETNGEPKTKPFTENDYVMKRIQEFLGGNAHAVTNIRELASLLGQKINAYLIQTRSYRKISPERMNEVSGRINQLLKKGFDEPSSLTLQDVNELIEIHKKNKERMWKIRYLGGKTRRKHRSHRTKSPKRVRTKKKRK